MNKGLWLAGVLAATGALAAAQTSPEPQPAPSSTQPSTATAKPQADTANQRSNAPAIPVLLDKSIDSKKAKAGDEIVAKTAVSMSNAQGTQIPQGTKVVGHIADAKAKSKGDPQSSLTFSFEKIVLKNGQEIPFRAIAQAIGAPQTSNMMMGPGGGGPNMQAPSGGGAGGTGSSPGGPATGGNTAGRTGGGGQAGGSPSAGGAGAGPDLGASGGPLPADASGAVGMKGVNLESQSNASVVSSDSKSVKLESGTQMLLRVVSQ